MWAVQAAIPPIRIMRQSHPVRFDAMMFGCAWDGRVRQTGHVADCVVIERPVVTEETTGLMQRRSQPVAGMPRNR
jgi:hypothetical protein